MVHPVWPEQETQVTRFISRFGNPSYRLLVNYAALPLVLTPELVHYLRTECLRDRAVPWEAESDLLLSDLCSQVGYELYAMDTQVRAYVLDQMQGDTVWQKRKQDVAQVLISYVNVLSRIDPNRRVREREAQRWAAMMYLGDERCQEAAQEIAARLKQLGDRVDAGDQSDHSMQSELARLTRIVQEMALELRDSSSSPLLDYAKVVQRVLRRDDDSLNVQQVYAVGDVALKVSPRLLPVIQGPLTDVDVDDLESFPPLEILTFTVGQCVVEPGGGFPPLVEQTVDAVTFVVEVEQEVVTNNGEVVEEDRGIALQPFSFDVVIVGSSLKQTLKGEMYEEQLGDNVTIMMVSIPAGRFMMGSPEDEPERSVWEGPQHKVEVPAFFMGGYPITQAQWSLVANNLPKIEQELESSPSNFKGKNHPVELVSWYDAVEFCQRLSQYTQKVYRLPSEAEWEYACRADTTSPFHFGDTISPDVANYRASVSYDSGPTGEYHQETVPVHYFQSANAFGLSGMHGNVDEWCQDHWHENYRGAPTDGRAWQENTPQSNKKARVRRGGSWYDNPRNCRSAYRYRGAPTNRRHSLGFRVVVSAPFDSVVPQGRTQ